MQNRASPALPPAAASFRPPALNAPIHLAAATRVISGVLYHSLRILRSVTRPRICGWSMISCGLQLCHCDRACFCNCVCPNRVNSRRDCTFFAKSDDGGTANRPRQQFPHRLFMLLRRCLFLSNRPKNNNWATWRSVLFDAKVISFDL